jgi:hypothetical protein
LKIITRGEKFMKKSILMALVALALLAAPAFAGDYSITANYDCGWGWSLVDKEDVPDANTFVNDFTMLGFFGSIDDFNSLAIQMEYGTSGSGMNINQIDGVGNDNDGHTFIDLRGTPILVTEFSLTTDILGSFGLTDIPVTLSMVNGYGRCNLHNRFQQWTGWEIKRWKDNGAAHFNGDYSGTGFNPAAWERTGYIKLNMGIMDMVNLSFGIVPLFGTTYLNSDGDVKGDVPVMFEAWASVPAGPIGLDVSVNMRKDGEALVAGPQITANMAFGAISLMVYLGEDYGMSLDPNVDGMDNLIAVAVKPTFGFGAGSASLGLWMTMNTQSDDLNTINPAEDSATQIDAAADVAVSFASVTVYGGLIMTDLTDANEDDESPMKFDIGVKNSFGAATIGIGVTGMAGTEDGTGTLLNQYDIGAADGSGINWLDADNNATATVYLRASVWY